MVTATSRAAKMAKANRLRDETILALREIWTELDAWDIQYPANSAGGEDLLLSPRAEKLIGLSFELKNQESLGIFAAIAQAVRNCKGRIPAVVFRRNHHEPYIAVQFSHYLGLRKQIRKLEKDFYDAETATTINIH